MCIGYVVKRYPVYSETFIVNEILAHEAAGLDVCIFALRPTKDTHFQDIIAKVRAPVCYLPSTTSMGRNIWAEMTKIAKVYPAVWETLSTSLDASACEVLQALVLADEIKKQGITHLHAHFATSATAVARMAAGICGITYSFTAHAKDIFHDNVDTEILRRKFNDAASVITVSNYNVDYLHNRLGTDAGRVQRIYNGLDLTRFEYQSPRSRAPNIVAVGRLVEKKGFKYLIEACHQLQQRGHSFHCRIIGTGELEQDLKNSIALFNLQDLVELTGPRPQQEVVAEFCSAAVLAAPCVIGQDGNRDGLPTVLLEAMALGTPCISTDVTGIPEILRDGETGLLVAQKDHNALADALEKFLFEPELRVSVAQRARSLIEAEFDVHANAAKLRRSFTGADEIGQRKVVAV